MLVVKSQNADKNQNNKKLRVHNQDNGAVILFYMQHFVQLVRRIQRTQWLQTLIEKNHDEEDSELILHQLEELGCACSY